MRKYSNYTVLVASSKAAKKVYNIENNYSQYFDIGGSYCFEGWKGLIGLYDEGGYLGLDELYGYTVSDIIGMVTNNSSMKTNSANDKFYIHKTVNGTDIQICMMKED